MTLRAYVAILRMEDRVLGHKGFRRAGMSSAILTQSVDTETECDGLLTYDRRITKYDREPLRAAARALVDAPL